MKQLGVRLGNDLWRSIEWYGRTAGHLRPDGQVDISETLRDLISRGLVQDRSTEAGYRNGYAAGRTAGYAAFMRGLAAAAPTSARRK